MKMKKRMAAALATTMAFSMAISPAAATWDGVDDYDKLSTAFQDTDSDVLINVTGNIVNDTGSTLVAGEDQSYVINGEQYTLTDMIFGGSGVVEATTKFEGQNEEGLTVQDDVFVIVHGNIEGVGEGADGAVAYDKSTLVVNGTVSSAEEDGVEAYDSAMVIVEGDVYGGKDADGVGADGVDASDDAHVTIQGNVYGGENGGDGIEADQNAQVVIWGDVYGGDGEKPDADGNLAEGNFNEAYSFSDGGHAVDAKDNSGVFVDGNVYGGDSYGTFGFAGNGIIAEDNAVVEVSGDAVGGEHIANPDIEPESFEVEGEWYDTIGYAGDGVCAGSGAVITVEGDAIGGNSSGQSGYAGNGVHIAYTLKEVEYEDEDTGEIVSKEVVPGSVVVKGDAINGEATAKNGVDGYSVAVDKDEDKVGPLDRFLLPQTYMDGILNLEDASDIRQRLNYISVNLIYNMAIGYYEHEERLEYTEELQSMIRYLAVTYGIEYDADADIQDVIAAVKDEDAVSFAKDVFVSFNDLAVRMAVPFYAIPDITVGGMVSTRSDAEFIGSNISGVNKYAESEVIELVDFDTEVDNEEDESDDDKNDKEQAGHEKNDQTDAPKTGDTSVTHLMGMIMAMSAVVLGGVCFTSKRKR